MGEPEAKKLRVDEIPEHLSAMNDDSKRSLVLLDSVQSELDKLSEEAAEEILKQKFNKFRQPVYAKRNDLIKNIPSFWCTAFLNHPQLSTTVQEHEEDILNSLKEMEVEEFEDIKSGYKITLLFTQNDYFETDRIEKTYQLNIDKPISTTTPIKWKDGRQPNKLDLNQGAPVRFLEWLNENVPPDSDEIAEVIKDDLFPNPLQYYLMPDIAEDDPEYERILEEDLDDEEEALDEVDDAGASDGDTDPLNVN